jgi:hypothetical protein
MCISEIVIYNFDFQEFGALRQTSDPDTQPCATVEHEPSQGCGGAIRLCRVGNEIGTESIRADAEPRRQIDLAARPIQHFIDCPFHSWVLLVAANDRDLLCDPGLERKELAVYL